MNARKGLEKKGTFLHCCWKPKLLTTTWRTAWRFLKNLKKTQILYGLEIPLLGLCPEKSMTGKDTPTPKFTASLFTTAKTWKLNVKEERMHKNMYIHTMECYSAIKQWNNAICSSREGPGDYCIKWSQSDRERQTSHAIIYMWNLKK